MSLTGGCLCGALRYRIEGEALAVRQCWCRDCQYIAAGGSTTNLFVGTDQLSLEGEPRYFNSTGDSGNRVERGFCPTCGTPLTTQSYLRRHLIAVRVGTLDDPAAAPPAQIIWASSAPAWAALDPALPQAAHQPPPAG